MESYTTSQPLSVPHWVDQPSFRRADLVLDGVTHRGPSYEGRIFLRDHADPTTPKDIEQGYAGSLYVFGHGDCFGDEGHCHDPGGPIHPFDYRRPHPLTPQVHVVRITNALQRLVETTADPFHVTIVPTTAKGQPAGDVLFFDRLTLVTYD
jgi:tyrosinase